MDASRDKVVTDDVAEASEQTEPTELTELTESTEAIVGTNDGSPSSQSRDKSRSRGKPSSKDRRPKSMMCESDLRVQISQISASVEDIKSVEHIDVISALTKKQSKDEEDFAEEVQGDRLEVPEKDLEDLSLKSVSDGDNSVFSDNPDTQLAQQYQRQNQSTDQSADQSADQPKIDQSENESEELDDIELIFTTDDTCRDLGLQEDLVSITEAESWQPPPATGQPVLLKYTKSAEGESLVCNGEKNSSVEEAVSSQSSSIDREESVDKFDESSNTRLNKMWSQCSVLVETDISKCGVVEEPEHSTRHAVRRNTLAAPPTAYR